MKAQQNMPPATFPVVPNTHTGCSGAYYVAVWIDTQRWYDPETLLAAQPKLGGEGLRSGSDKLLSDPLISKTEPGMSEQLSTRKPF